jgi:hypothetical protein
MVPFSLTRQLDGATLSRVEAAAAAAGLSTEAWVAEVIADALSLAGVAEEASPFKAGDPRTGAARRHEREQPRIALAEYDRTGVSSPLEDVLRDVRADLEARLASKA